MVPAAIAPAAAMYALTLAAVGDRVNMVLNLAALAVLVAGVFVVAKLRAESTASRGAAEAWHEERDAEKAKADRLEAENRLLLADNTALNAKPDMDKVWALIKTEGDSSRERDQQLGETLTNVAETMTRIAGTFDRLDRVGREPQ